MGNHKIVTPLHASCMNNPSLLFAYGDRIKGRENTRAKDPRISRVGMYTSHSFHNGRGGIRIVNGV